MRITRKIGQVNFSSIGGDIGRNLDSCDRDGPKIEVKSWGGIMECKDQLRSVVNPKLGEQGGLAWYFYFS